MKSKVQNGISLVLDPFYVQLYFLLGSFVSEIPLIMGYVQTWKKIGLVWAALVILWDIFTTRRILKMRFSLPIAGLLASYAVTVAVVCMVFPASGYETALNWVCSFVTLWVMYPPVSENVESGLRRLGAINWLVIGMTTLAAAVGIGMFLGNWGGYVYSAITDYNYPQGFVAGRLTGVYRNAIYPSAFIGMAAAVVEWVRLKGRRVVLRILLAVCALLNFVHIVLSNSRGITFAVALFAALVALCLLYRRLNGAVKRWGVGLSVAAVAAVLVILVTPHVRQACAHLPQYFPTITIGEKEEDKTPAPDTEEEETPEAPPATEDPKPNNGPVNMDRDHGQGSLTGRPVIWKQGLDAFLKRPLLGYGPFTLKDEIRLSDTSTEQLSHFHNVFLQSLVSIGVVGSVFFFVLLCGAAWRVLRRLLISRDHPHYAVLAVLAAMLAALVLINMADTTLFFLSKNSEFVFWCYLGYAMLLVGDAPYRLDAPMRGIDRLLNRKDNV